MTFCLFVAGVAAQADEVILKDGDVLQGRITKTTESSVTLFHKVFGELEVPKDQIESMTVLHDALGEITVDAEGVASFGLEKTTAEAAPQQDLPAKLQEEKEKKEKEETAFLEPQFAWLNAYASRLKKTRVPRDSCRFL